MGSFVPVATQALNAFQTVSSVAKTLNTSSSDVALKQLQQQQNLQQQLAYENAQLKREEILLNAQDSEKERKSALKRAVARQRANFGARGVGSQADSSEAVLLGLFEESEEDKESRERLDAIKLKSLDQNLFQQNRVNTLKRTQLSEKEKIGNTSSLFDSADCIIGIFS